MNDKKFDTIPLCVRPWIHLNLGWDKFGFCCNAYKEDFGKIKGFSSNANVHKEIFNHANYINVREILAKGEVPDVCAVCSNYADSGNLQQTLKRELELLAQIEDLGQRMRATANFERAIASMISKEKTVTHKPVYAIISCGSACNLKCKFCYNCNMDYNPETPDILNVIDQVHEALIFAQLTGGEPLVTKAGRALLKEFASGRYKFAVRLGTNAQYTDFDLLRPVNLADVQISTDAATKKVYETVRIGGNFEDLISNIKSFIELKKEKPYMKITTNFTVTSDNYMEIPEAVKLYENLGTFTMFNAVMREKNDPQNFKERPELYDDILKKVDEGIRLSSSPFTIEKLETIKSTICKKMEEKKAEQTATNDVSQSTHGKKRRFSFFDFK